MVQPVKNSSDRFVVRKAFVVGSLLAAPFAMVAALEANHTAPLATQTTASIAPPAHTVTCGYPAPVTPPAPPSVVAVRAPSEQQQSTPQQETQGQTTIEARWGGNWYSVETQGRGCGPWMRVHWTGYGTEWDSLVHERELRRRGEQSEPLSLAQLEGQNLRPSTMNRVEVRMGSTWRRARVLGTLCNGLLHIDYDEYDDRYNETVPRSRVRSVR